MTFSQTFFVAGNRLLVKRSSGIAKLQDLSGQGVASTAGSTALKQLVILNSDRKLNLRIMPGLDLAETFLLLEMGRANAVFLDDVLLTSMAAGSRSPADYQIVGEPMSVEPYAVMFRKDDPAFKAAVDRAMTALFKTRQIEGLYRKWFESPIEPRSINLGFPPSDLTRHAWEHPSDSADPAAYLPRTP